jgi:hypothetical protein
MNIETIRDIWYGDFKVKVGDYYPLDAAVSGMKMALAGYFGLKVTGRISLRPFAAYLLSAAATLALLREIIGEACFGQEAWRQKSGLRATLLRIGCWSIFVGGFTALSVTASKVSVGQLRHLSVAFSRRLTVRLLPLAVVKFPIRNLGHLSIFSAKHLVCKFNCLSLTELFSISRSLQHRIGSVKLLKTLLASLPRQQARRILPSVLLNFSAASVGALSVVNALRQKANALQGD